MSTLHNISRKVNLGFGKACCLCNLLEAYTFTTFRRIAMKSADISHKLPPATLVSL